MKVFFVGAGPGDPELLTLKALRILQACKICIYAGSLVDPVLLQNLPPDCEKYDSALLTLEETMAVMLNAHQQNIDVVRLHSGEPAIYGAIGEQIRKLRESGIDYEQVPGISSFQAAAAALQVELTCPEISQTVVLTRSPGRTPLPGEKAWLEGFHRHATYCLFLSVHQMSDLTRLLAGKMGEECPCAVVYHASRPDQKVLRGSLKNIADFVQQAGIRNTAMVIVGYALDPEEHTKSRLYAADFSHEFREAQR